VAHRSAIEFAVTQSERCASWAQSGPDLVTEAASKYVTSAVISGTPSSGLGRPVA
jgi:hypothetical protein